MIVNGWSDGVWKKALKNGASVVAGVLIANITDPTMQLYSLPWFKHAFVGSVSVFLVTELSYIKNWWSNGNGNGG